MPTQQEEKVEYSLDEWVATFQGDARRNYTLEFIKAEGLDKNDRLLGNDKEELVVVTLSCVEDNNIFIAISGHRKEFDCLNLASVVKELTEKEEQYQSMNISMGALSPEKSLAKRKEKLDSSKPVVSFITQSFGNDDTSVENLLKNRSDKDKDKDDSDKSVQFKDLGTNAFFDKNKKQNNSNKNDKNNNSNNEKENDNKTDDNSNNNNEKDNSKGNNDNNGNDIAAMIAAAVAKADEVDETENSKEEKEDEFKSLDNIGDFPDLDQNLFGDSDNIHATFAELVECIADCDVDVNVTESKLKDNKILINFKLVQMTEQIVRAKTVFADSSYEKWKEFKSDFGTVDRKSKLVIDDLADYDSGFLVDGTMVSVTFNFEALPNLHDKWKKLVSSIEKNPVIENIIALLAKDEDAKVHVVDKLETDGVVSVDFKPQKKT